MDSSGSAMLSRALSVCLLGFLSQVWQVPEGKCHPGHVQHTLGWPLQKGPLDKTYGGGFIYHMAPDMVLVGLVVGLDYANPYLNPYK